MMRRSKARIIIIIALFLIGLFFIGVATTLFTYNQDGFSGSRVKNPDSYLLDIEIQKLLVGVIFRLHVVIM